MYKRKMSQGHGLIEMSISLLLFTIVALTLARLVAHGYTWYQEAALIHQAITLLSDGGNNNHGLSAVKREVVTPYGPVVLRVETASWKGSSAIRRSLSRITFNETESL
jgi:hypothetical protein